MIECQLIDNNKAFIRELKILGNDKFGNSNCTRAEKALGIEEYLQSYFPSDEVVDGIIKTERFGLSFIEFKTGKHHHELNSRTRKIDFYGIKAGGHQIDNFQDSKIFKKYMYTKNNLCHSILECCNKCYYLGEVQKNGFEYILVEDPKDVNFLDLMFRLQCHFKDYNVKFYYIPYEHFNNDLIKKNSSLGIQSII